VQKLTHNGEVGLFFRCFIQVFNQIWFWWPSVKVWSRYSDGLRAGRLLRFPAVQDFSLLHSLGPSQPPLQWVPGVLSSGVKRQGREADHSLSNAEVKKGGAIPPLRHMSSGHRA
jgi:hypothetical protein